MINVGQEVKDTVTGFTGIITDITEYIYGMNRACVQPRELKDGKPQDPRDFDVSQLIVVNEKPDGVIIINPKSSKITLGSKVKCSVSGAEGIAWGIGTFLNGCRRVGVNPGVDKNNKIENLWFDEGQLEIIKADVITRGDKITGGPQKVSNGYWNNSK